MAMVERSEALWYRDYEVICQPKEWIILANGERSLERFEDELNIPDIHMCDIEPDPEDFPVIPPRDGIALKRRTENGNGR
jgi:hypothetical protein